MLVIAPLTTRAHSLVRPMPVPAQRILSSGWSLEPDRNEFLRSLVPGGLTPLRHRDDSGDVMFIYVGLEFQPPPSGL